MKEKKSFFLGNKRFQRFYHYLFKLGLRGMNYGRGSLPESSGEKYVLRRLKNHFSSSQPRIFDVGANQGQYARQIFGVFDKNCEVFSFEPSPAAFTELDKFTREGYYKFNFGFGSGKTETAVLYSNVQGSEWASLYATKHVERLIELNKEEQVRLSSIDRFCEEQNIKTIQFLKLDVEGHEIEVLKGAAGMLKSGGVDFIQFELGLASIPARIFLKDFFSVLPDYRIYRVLQNGFAEIIYSEDYEIFGVTNYLAVRKGIEFK